MSEETTTAPASTGPTTAATETTTAAPAAAPTDWLSSIEDEEARGLVEQKKYKTPGELATAYRHMVKLHGRAPDVLGLPDKEDDTEGWNQVYSRLGRPDKPENYAYKPPEGMQVEGEYLKSIQESAHKAGLSQKQFEALAKANDEFIQGQLGRNTAESAEADVRSIEQLKRDFGGDKAFDDATAAGKRAAKALGLDPDTLDSLDKAVGVPSVLKLLATIGKKVATEDQFLEGVDQDGFGMSSAQARSEMDRLKGDKEFQNSLLSPMTANHKANLAKWQELQRVAFSKGQ